MLVGIPLRCLRMTCVLLGTNLAYTRFSDIVVVKQKIEYIEAALGLGRLDIQYLTRVCALLGVSGVVSCKTDIVQSVSEICRECFTYELYLIRKVTRAGSSLLFEDCLKTTP